jgi:hypothetical protein
MSGTDLLLRSIHEIAPGRKRIQKRIQKKSTEIQLCRARCGNTSQAFRACKAREAGRMWRSGAAVRWGSDRIDP